MAQGVVFQDGNSCRCWIRRGLNNVPGAPETPDASFYQKQVPGPTHILEKEISTKAQTQGDGDRGRPPCGLSTTVGAVLYIVLYI